MKKYEIAVVDTSGMTKRKLDRCIKALKLDDASARRLFENMPCSGRITATSARKSKRT